MEEIAMSCACTSPIDVGTEAVKIWTKSCDGGTPKSALSKLWVNIHSKLKPFWICFGDTEVALYAFGNGSCAGDILTN